jgi:hypothetical protein
MFALGALGALGVGGTFAAFAAKRRADAKKRQAIDDFDYTDLDEPVVIEEVVIVTEADPYGIDMEMYSDEGQQKQAAGSEFEMPGRGAGPR